MKMVKPNIKKCQICLLGIDLDNDNYCRLTDYRRGKFFTEGFYHAKCFNDRIKGDPRMKKAMVGLIKKANKLMKNMGVEEEEEYVIRG